MSDREELAGLIGDKTPYWAADTILASDWLRERDKQIAREVEALVREETKAGIAGLLDESVVGLAKWHLVQLVREWEPKSNGNGDS